MKYPNKNIFSYFAILLLFCSVARIQTAEAAQKTLKNLGTTVVSRLSRKPKSPLQQTTPDPSALSPAPSLAKPPKSLYAAIANSPETAEFIHETAKKLALAGGKIENAAANVEGITADAKSISKMFLAQASQFLQPINTPPYLKPAQKPLTLDSVDPADEKMDDEADRPELILEEQRLGGEIVPLLRLDPKEAAEAEVVEAAVPGIAQNASATGASIAMAFSFLGAGARHLNGQEPTPADAESGGIEIAQNLQQIGQDAKELLENLAKEGDMTKDLKAIRDFFKIAIHKIAEKIRTQSTDSQAESKGAEAEEVSAMLELIGLGQILENIKLTTADGAKAVENAKKTTENMALATENIATTTGAVAEAATLATDKKTIAELIETAKKTNQNIKNFTGNLAQLTSPDPKINPLLKKAAIKQAADHPQEERKELAANQHLENGAEENNNSEESFLNRVNNTNTHIETIASNFVTLSTPGSKNPIALGVVAVGKTIQAQAQPVVTELTRLASVARPVIIQELKDLKKEAIKEIAEEINSSFWLTKILVNTAIACSIVLGISYFGLKMRETHFRTEEIKLRMQTTAPA